MIAYKKFYHCKRLPSAEPDITEFSEPIEKYGNYQPLSGYIDAVTFGESIMTKWRMFVPMSQYNEYHEKDLLYLDEAVETDFSAEGYENGDGANAEITAVLPQNLKVRIEISRIIKKGA